MKKLFLILISLLFTTFSFAQTVSITGKISNSGDNTPVAGASLAIKGTVSGMVARA